jgi:hypothetical protein
MLSSLSSLPVTPPPTPSPYADQENFRGLPIPRRPQFSVRTNPPTEKTSEYAWRGGGSASHLQSRSPWMGSPFPVAEPGEAGRGSKAYPTATRRLDGREEAPLRRAAQGRGSDSSLPGWPASGKAGARSAQRRKTGRGCDVALARSGHVSFTSSNATAWPRIMPAMENRARRPVDGIMPLPRIR